METETLRIHQISECTICRGSLRSETTVYCAACLSRYHPDCFADHAQCAVIGCMETRVVRPLENATEVATEAQLPVKRVRKSKVTSSKSTLIVAMFALTITTGIGVYSLKNMNDRLEFLSQNLQSPEPKAEPPKAARVLTDEERLSDVKRLNAIARARTGTQQSEAIAKLALYLNDHVAIRQEAARLLGTMPADSSEYLLKALNHWDQSTRQTISEALIVQFDKHPKVLLGLTAMLDDKDPIVRAQAASTLEEIGEDAHSSLNKVLLLFDDENDKVRFRALMAARAITTKEQGSISFEAFKKALKSPDAAVQGQALENICDLVREDIIQDKTLVLNLLIQGLQDPNGSVRSQAAYALSSFGTDFPKATAPAMPALMKATKDKESNVRLWTIETIGQIGKSDPRSFEALLPALLDGERGVRQKATDHLSRMTLTSKQLLPLLVSALKNPSAAIRAFAAQRIGRLSNDPITTSFVTQFMGTVNDKDRYIRRSILSTLGEMGPRAEAAVPLLITVLKDPQSKIEKDEVIACIGRTGKNSALIFKPLFEVITAGPERLGNYALKVLLNSACPIAQCLPRMIDALKHPSKDLRLKALQLIRRQGLDGKAATPSLIEMLSDPKNNEIKQQVIQTLAEVAVESPKSILAVLPMLRGNERDTPINAIVGFMLRIRKKALFEDSRISAPALKLLSEALNDEHTLVRCYAANAIQRLGSHGSDAIPGLIQTLGDEIPEVRDAASEALIAIGPKVIPTVSRAFLKNNENEDVKVQVARILGELGAHSKDQLESLRLVLENGKLKNKETRTAIKDAMSKIRRSVRRESKK
ncbi:MAG: HEAT repeat domain-containing protein [Planctomycetota bacterium]|nr:HEAT repeat domain-containing protein [Planctomycetota bacterium]